MDSLSIDAIGQRTLSSVTNLLGREIAVKLVALVGGIVVARRLAPSAFGLFAIATFALGIFTLFSELGLGAALIRKVGDVSKRELDALFTFQLVLVALLSTVLLGAAPLLAGLYRSPDLAPVLRALAIAFLLSSLRTTPTVAAERRLQYGPIALADVLGQVGYWTIAVIGSLLGLAVWSLVMALIGSAFFGTLVLYVATRYRPALNLHWQSIRSNARFGVLYQGQTLTGFVKDSISPSVGGIAYGGPAVGYLTWAQQLAVVPLVLTHHVGRVSYPALARLRSNPVAFSRLADATVAWTYRLTFPAFAVLAGLAPQIIEHLYGPKWFPAEPSLYFFVINMILGVGTGLLIPVLYSVGQAGVALRITIGWTVATLALALALMAAGLGFTSIAIAYAAGTAGALAAVLLALRRLVAVDAIRPALVPLMNAALMSLVLYLTAPLLVHSTWSLVLLAAAAGVVGLTVNVWKDRHSALRFLAQLRSGLRR